MFVLLTVLVVFGASNLPNCVYAGPAPPCVTPNGENATCIPLNLCDVIKQGLFQFDADAIDFANKSRCGYKDETALVCCGSTSQLTAAAVTTTVHPEAHTKDAEQIIGEDVPAPTPVPNGLPDPLSCGVQIVNRRIVGGKITGIDEFPWMAALKYTKSEGNPEDFRCSGTLISSRYVLTAAQCLFVRGVNLTAVRLGEWRFSTTNDCVEDTETNETCADPVLDMGIAERIPNPFYSKQTGNNDIALLYLEKEVHFTEYIKPICLPPGDMRPSPPGTKMHISGWGITENGSQSDVKLKVEIPVVGNKQCQGIYKDYMNINPNQECAGGEEGKDACNGDSGGPLMHTFQYDHVKEPQWYQEGIIYRGLGCGNAGIPGLYTRVTRYVKWIQETISNQNM